MKRFILLLIIFICVSDNAFAATPTPSKATTNQPTETSTINLSEKITDLKDKIASKVAQLNLVEKRGIFGTITEVKPTLITITDVIGTKRLVDVDEITKFTSSSSKEIGISDLKNGQKIAVIGLFNKDSQHLLARFITTSTPVSILSGTVTGVDDESSTLKILTTNTDETTINVENVTKTALYRGTTSEKAGFSDILRGNRVLVVGYPDTKDAKRIIATRLLVFPDLPKNPQLVVPDNAIDTSQGSTTSTGSANKITPLR